MIKMSFLKTQALGLAGTLLGKLLTIQPSRSFADFSEFCSIVETHNLAVTPTQYPIEDGTQGTDHIVKSPTIISWDLIFGERSNPQETYESLQDLLFSGVPFTAVTGLKTYDNLVLTSLTANQDSHTARILSCSLTMQEIIITTVQTTTMPARNQQANANVTASTVKSGTRQVETPKTVLESDLSRGWGNSKKFLGSLF